MNNPAEKYDNSIICKNVRQKTKKKHNFNFSLFEKFKQI
jgi:hypothetical protein